MQLQEALDMLTSTPMEHGPALGVLLTSIAHDGRSPLSAIELDLFSIEHLLGRLESGGDVAPVLAVCGHIQRCARDLEQMFALLEQHGEELRRTSEPQP